MDDQTETRAVMLRGVEKAYRRGANLLTALANVHLDVQQGEFLFLSGPSGSGKTTLLSIIGCLLQPDQGELWIHGQNVGGLSKAQITDLRRTQIGFMFQRFNLIRGLNAIENVAVPMLLQRESTLADALAWSRQLLEVVGLAAVGEQNPRQLSVGQCQRVALARALAMTPSLLLADEPTASLDSASGLRAIKLLKRLTHERGMTSIIVTHDPRIVAFADRVVHVEDGQLTTPPRRRPQSATTNPAPMVPATATSNSTLRAEITGQIENWPN